MALRSVTNGKISETGTINLQGAFVGGVLVSTDGTNAAEVTIRKDSDAGDIVIAISTKTPIFIGPALFEASGTIYYSISGNGASAQIYEWIVQ